VGNWRIFFDLTAEQLLIEVRDVVRRTTTTYRKRWTYALNHPPLAARDPRPASAALRLPTLARRWRKRRRSTISYSPDLFPVG
jgi:hypothetical protein